MSTHQALVGRLVSKGFLASEAVDFATKYLDMHAHELSVRMYEIADSDEYGPGNFSYEGLREAAHLLEPESYRWRENMRQRELEQEAAAQKRQERLQQVQREALKALPDLLETLHSLDDLEDRA